MQKNQEEWAYMYSKDGKGALQMSSIQELLRRVDVLADRSGRSVATISRKIMNDGKGVARLKAGGQCTVKTLDEALDLLEGLENEFLPNGGQVRQANTTPKLRYLERLESESIRILREGVAECARPALLYSAGKDSIVLTHLARKAFFPAKPSFPFLHVDTGWKFAEMYAFRDRFFESTKLKLLQHINADGVRRGISPVEHGSAIHIDIMKTEGLKQALHQFEFDCVFGGARRDEEKSRSKERVFSVRDSEQHWNPKSQRPELWHIYNTKLAKGESLRVFPLSNWTEVDIWQYIERENIKIPSLYFAKMRNVVRRDNMWIMVDDDRLNIQPDEVVEQKMVRFRTLGCYPLTGAIESRATTVQQIIKELESTELSERGGRQTDRDIGSSLEAKKQAGYF
jgi:sulfate adenylyltransferase subunit 2